jgi:hypothetical protein
MVSLPNILALSCYLLRGANNILHRWRNVKTIWKENSEWNSRTIHFVIKWIKWGCDYIEINRRPLKSSSMYEFEQEQHPPPPLGCLEIGKDFVLFHYEWWREKDLGWNFFDRVGLPHPPPPGSNSWIRACNLFIVLQCIIKFPCFTLYTCIFRRVWENHIFGFINMCEVWYLTYQHNMSFEINTICKCSSIDITYPCSFTYDHRNESHRNTKKYGFHRLVVWKAYTSYINDKDTNISRWTRQARIQEFFHNILEFLANHNCALI